VSISNTTKFRYNIPDTLKFPIFVLLIVTGLILESVVHCLYGINTGYTHFFYLIIFVAALWYGRKAIWVALIFGSLHVAVSLVLEGPIPWDAFFRAFMLLIVAVIAGTVVEEMKKYHEQVLMQNHELKEVNGQLDASQNAFLAANKKLNLLSSITRHDIKNQLTALLMYIELSKMIDLDPGVKSTIAKEEIVANNILRQIEFTKEYEDIGVNSPQWQNVTQIVSGISSDMKPSGVFISVSTGDLEVYADPLLRKVFENLVDNSIRHGEHIRQISITCEKEGQSLFLIYRDDGVGVPDADKTKIFDKGFGKNTGLGLFLTREILSITGISIRESGTYGQGVIFTMQVPDGGYRFNGKKAVLEPDRNVL